MRRLVIPVVAVFGLLAAGAASASAAPAPSAGATEPPNKICKIENKLLVELSGLVAMKDGYVVINDGTDVESRRKVFFLDDKCKVTKQVAFDGLPRDVEDLALSPDGTKLWIADIGDNVTNSDRRATVALWSMPVDGSKKPIIHRIKYPDGKHDAEALLMNGDGTPIIVTKDGATPGVYVPAAPLKENNSADEAVELKKVATITLPPSTTSNPLQAPGRMLVTGGAVAPDGSRAALRTYADALEWDVANGDVVAAIQKPPRVTPLPDEPRGESLAYTPDGTRFLTVSDMGDYQSDTTTEMLSYARAQQVMQSAVKGDTAPQAKAAASGSWYDKLTLSDITYLIGAVGILGAVLVGAGVVGIVRARRRPDAEEAAEAGAADADTAMMRPVSADAVSVPAGQQPAARAGAAAGRPNRSGAVYGGAHPSAPAASAPGGVYGDGTVIGSPFATPAPPAAPTRGGGVYGGKPGGTPVGANPAGPPPAGPPPAGPPPAGPTRGGVYGGGPAGSVYGGQPAPPAPVRPARPAPARPAPARPAPARPAPAPPAPQAPGVYGSRAAAPQPPFNGSQPNEPDGDRRHYGAGRYSPQERSGGTAYRAGEPGYAD